MTGIARLVWTKFDEGEVRFLPGLFLIDDISQLDAIKDCIAELQAVYNAHVEPIRRLTIESTDEALAPFRESEDRT